MWEACWHFVRVGMIVMGVFASLGVLVVVMYAIVYLTEDT